MKKEKSTKDQLPEWWVEFCCQPVPSAKEWESKKSDRMKKWSEGISFMSLSTPEHQQDILMDQVNTLTQPDESESTKKFIRSVIEVQAKRLGIPAEEVALEVVRRGVRLNQSNRSSGGAQ